MTLAWFITGYKIRADRPSKRYCMMDDFTPQIVADGGVWSESECLGGYAVVKVKANDATLDTIGGTSGFYRIPYTWATTETMTSLTNANYNVIRARLRQAGYTDAEINTALGPNVAGWRTHTFLQLLNFICQRRLTPRWDATLRQVVLDGAAVSCRPPKDIDERVK